MPLTREYQQATAATTVSLREAVAGLVWLAAGEEALLLAATQAEGEGSPSRWSAVAAVAHNSDFRQEQIARMSAMRAGEAPPEFARVDHEDPEVYARLAPGSRRQALERSRSTTIALIDELAAALDEDLLDPARHPWLRGRMLWLQIVVRGFWHPLGHVGDYYLHHGSAERALALYAHALATARYLHAPPPALGMACYSLACTEAVCGRLEEAAVTIAEAAALNEDLRQRMASEPDLAPLRSAGKLEQIIAQP